MSTSDIGSIPNFHELCLGDIDAELTKRNVERSIIDIILQEYSYLKTFTERCGYKIGIDNPSYMFDKTNLRLKVNVRLVYSEIKTINHVAIRGCLFIDTNNKIDFYVDKIDNLSISDDCQSVKVTKQSKKKLSEDLNLPMSLEKNILITYTDFFDNYKRFLAKVNRVKLYNQNLLKSKKHNIILKKRDIANNDIKGICDYLNAHLEGTGVKAHFYDSGRKALKDKWSIIFNDDLNNFYDYENGSFYGDMTSIKNIKDIKFANYRFFNTNSADYIEINKNENGTYSFYLHTYASKWYQEQIDSIYTSLLMAKELDEMKPLLVKYIDLNKELYEKMLKMISL